MEQEIPNPKRAYVVDDDDVFRNSMLRLLSAAGWLVKGFGTIGEFQVECDNLDPGVVLLDVRMPGVGGLEFLESESDAISKFAIFVVTGHGDVGTAVRCLKAGAVDFIEKPFAGDKLIETIEGSYEGLLQRIAESQRTDQARAKVASLSKRELDVLRSLIRGDSYKVAAHRLGISARTVEMYRNNLTRKLGVKSTAEAVKLGVLGGMVARDESATTTSH